MMTPTRGERNRDLLLTMPDELPLKVSVTRDCIMVTAIDLFEGGIQVTEHDSMTLALDHLRQHPDIISGNFRRVFIGNPEGTLSDSRSIAWECIEATSPTHPQVTRGKIAAIKEYRIRTGCGLLEAKTAIDQAWAEFGREG